MSKIIWHLHEINNIETLLYSVTSRQDISTLSRAIVLCYAVVVVFFVVVVICVVYVYIYPNIYPDTLRIYEDCKNVTK